MDVFEERNNEFFSVASIFVMYRKVNQPFPCTVTIATSSCDIELPPPPPPPPPCQDKAGSQVSGYQVIEELVAYSDSLLSK